MIHICKLAYIKTQDGMAYKRCVDMIRFQENVTAGQSTGFVWRDRQGFHIRKSIGKVNSFLAKYPDILTNVNECLGHSRWATISPITIDNQHPIPIMYKGTKLAYGVHNGTFHEYQSYEYLRNDISNKTDSALLLTMFGRMLERLGDSKLNRVKSFSYIMSLINQGSGNHNLIIMFKDGMVLFSGNVLTYKVNQNNVGIMTFGLPEQCQDNVIYEIKDFTVIQLDMVVPPFRFKPREPKVLKVKTQKSKNSVQTNLESLDVYETEMSNYEREMRRDMRR